MAEKVVLRDGMSSLGERYSDTATLAPSLGGTGLTSYTQGDMIYASAANVLARLAHPGAASRLLVTPNTTGVAWQAGVADGNYTIGDRITPVTGNLGIITITNGVITAIQQAT